MLTIREYNRDIRCMEPLEKPTVSRIIAKIKMYTVQELIRLRKQILRIITKIINDKTKHKFRNFSRINND